MSELTEVKVSALPSKLPWVEGEDYAVIAGIPADGDFVRRRRGGYEDFRVKRAEPAAPPPSPVIMTDKQFRKFVQAKLGVGVYGTAFKAASESADGSVLDAYAAWSKADTYEKAEVAAFTAALVSANILTAQQRTSLVGNGNWPEA